MTEVEIRSRIEVLYGKVDWAAAEGVVHVAAVAGVPPCAIAIGPDAPASPMDRFVLGFARARADAILTSGAILRAEPDLVHRYSDAMPEQKAFARWRENVLGKSEPPALLVLSRSGNYPASHPALVAAERGFVWSSQARSESAQGVARNGLAIELADQEMLSMRENVCGAIERARSSLNARTILIEAGPTISTALYSGPGTQDCRVDELLLSRFAGDLEPGAVGPDFVSERLREEVFGAPLSVTDREEPSGRWRFERYRSAD